MARARPLARRRVRRHHKLTHDPGDFRNHLDSHCFSTIYLTILDCAFNDLDGRWGEMTSASIIIYFLCHAFALVFP